MKYTLFALFVLCSIVLVGCGSPSQKPTDSNPIINTPNDSEDDSDTDEEKDDDTNDEKENSDNDNDD